MTLANRCKKGMTVTWNAIVNDLTVITRNTKGSRQNPRFPCPTKMSKSATAPKP